jgi:hypothetical protein
MWQAFGAFAEAPSAERKQAVLEADKAVDSINGGYWGGRTSRASRTAHRIEGIERGDPGNLGPVSLSSPVYEPTDRASGPCRKLLPSKRPKNQSDLSCSGQAAGRTPARQLPGDGPPVSPGLQKSEKCGPTPRSAKFVLSLKRRWEATRAPIWRLPTTEGPGGLR